MSSIDNFRSLRRASILAKSAIVKFPVKYTQTTDKSFKCLNLWVIDVLVDRSTRPALPLARYMHFALETIYTLEWQTAEPEGGVHDADPEGGLVEYLQPGVVLNPGIGLAVPAGPGLPLGVHLPAGHEEGARPEDDLPAQDVGEGQQQGRQHTRQVVAVALAVVGEPACVGARVPAVVDALVHQVA